MPITINGEAFPDGSPLTINGTQAQTVTVNGTPVWQNNQAPSAITDFNASDDQIDQITVTFTPASGVPTPTHDLVRVDTGEIIASNISSGYVWSTTIAEVELRVDAKNTAGATPSNTNIGRTVAPPGSVVFDTAGNHTFTVPRGYTSVSVCMVGGGGAGGRGEDNDVGGGHAGQVISQNYSVSSETVSVTVAATSTAAGNSSKFGTLTASGGAAGDDYSGDHPGNGASRTTCGGTGNDGLRIKHELFDYYFYGGESSGFGDGLDGRTENQFAGVGSGGGGVLLGNSVSGGGRGEVRVSWGSNAEEELRRLAEDPDYLERRKVSNLDPMVLDNLGIKLNVE